MEDDRIWAFEESLWSADPEHYRELMDETCVLALPSQPHLHVGEDAIRAVSNTPRWKEVRLEDRQVMRPQEGLIVIGYHAIVSRDDESYEAYCTTTMRRLSHDEWRVVQHQQTPPLVAGS